MAKLFKQNRQLAAIAAQDAKIIFHEAPFIQYEQFRVNNNFRQYLETIMISKKVLQMACKKHLWKGRTNGYWHWRAKFNGRIYSTQ